MPTPFFRLLTILASLTLATIPASAATITSQDFGSSPIATPVKLSVTVPSVTQGPASISLRYAIDFSLGACTQTATGCTAVITFDPTNPGLRQDALIVKDTTGKVVEEIFLHGIGLGPLAVFSPAIATYESCLGEACGYLTVTGIAAEANGKFLILNGTVNLNGIGSSICEFDPATGNCTNIPGTPSQAGPSLTFQGIAVDAAGNIFYINNDEFTTVGVGIHRLDAFTATDTLIISGSNISNLAIAPTGTIYYTQSNQIFAANPNTFAVSLTAGNGTQGFSGDAGPALKAELSFPSAIALDAAGNLYVADSGNSRVRKIDRTGNITTVAGNGGFTDSGDGGLATNASFSYIKGLAVDPAGDIYVSGGLTRRIDSGTGLISTIAGGGDTAYPFTAVGFSASAQSVSPGYFTFDPTGNIWILNAGGLYEISSSPNPIQFPSNEPSTQTVSLLNAGTSNLKQPLISISGLNATDFSASSNCGTQIAPGATCTITLGITDGPHITSAATVTFVDNASSSPQTISVAGSNRGIPPTYHQIAGATIGSSTPPQAVNVQFPGSATGITAVLAYGIDFTLGSLSCSGTSLVICNTTLVFTPRYPGLVQDAIIFLDASGAMVYQCFLSATGQGPQWFSNPGQTATLTLPPNTVLSAIDAAGNLYAISTQGGPQSGLVYKFTKSTGQWKIVAGQLLYSGVNTGDDGPAINATLAYVNAVLLDAAGNMYLGETFGIRRVDARTGIITTLAQQGGDFFAIDNQGNIYFSNTFGNDVFKFNPASGMIVNYAGGGTGAYGTSSGDGGPATAANLNMVGALGLDAVGNLFLSTSSGLRKVDATTGIISTVGQSCGGMTFDPAGDIIQGCGYPAAPSSGTQLATGPYNSYGPLLRDPSGIIYSAGGTIWYPSLQTPFTMPSAVLGSSSQATIALTNTGNAPLPVSSVMLGGANVALFSQSNTCIQSLAPAQSCAINLTFTPSQGSTDTTTLTVSSALPPLQSTITASGLTGTLTFNRNSIDFGTQPSSISFEEPIIINNQTLVPITFSSVSLAGPNASDFTLQSTCPSTLAAYQYCQLDVTFHAGAYGARAATLNIVDNAAGSPQIIPLTAVVSGTSFVSAQNPGAARNNDSGFFGFAFKVGPAPIQVYSLARDSAYGNTGSHLVELLQADGTNVAGGSATVTIYSGYSGFYFYAPLASPVTLAANTTYYLVSQEIAGGDDWYDAGPITTSSAATVLGPAYSDSSNRLNIVSGMPGQAYGPLNFLYNTSGPSAQTITFQPLPNVTFGVAPFTLTATASSGLPVSYTSSTTPVCTVSGSTVTVLSAGTCTISASQAGNATYTAAVPVTQSFTVSTAAAAAPYVSYVAYWGINNTGITISWSTDMQATTQLAYGTTTALGQLSPLQTALTNSHGVTLTTLNPGTTYYFVAQSANASGATGHSSTYSFTTSGTATTPVAPVISSVLASNITTTSATITWATDQAASSQVNYGLSTAYGSSSTLSSSLVTSHSVTLTGLTAGTTYNFDVVSANSTNQSATSTNSTFTTGTASTGGPPPQVGYVNYWGINNTGIIISWSTDVPATTQLAYGTTTALGQLSPLQTALTNSHGVTLTTLNPGTTYYFVAQSTSATGVTGHSTTYSFTTSGVAANPAPIISSVASTNITGTSATITWITDQATSSQVNFGTTTSYGSSSTLSTSLVTSHSVTLTGLTAGTTYNFDVVSANSANVAASSPNTTFTTSTASTATPPYVGYVNYWGINSTGITISWSTDMQATTQLAYGTTKALGQLSPLQTTLSNSHGVVLTTLSPGTTYYFVAQSQAANGATGYSATYSFTTP